MPRNIVVCRDGTGNQYGRANSNVVKLYWTLAALDKQAAYYHPGVGTMGARNALSAPGKWWTKVRGLAFGYGFSDNIADVYSFLMREFNPGDKIFLFGFSRGSYTARGFAQGSPVHWATSATRPWCGQRHERHHRRGGAALGGTGRTYQSTARFHQV
jgi:uncharacterized protein (DUF2235 family)